MKELGVWIICFFFYSGYSGVDPNFHPWMVVWMCNAGKEMEEKRKEMHRFLSVTDRVLAHKVNIKKNYLQIHTHDQLTNWPHIQ